MAEIEIRIDQLTKIMTTVNNGVKLHFNIPLVAKKGEKVRFIVDGVEKMVITPTSKGGLFITSFDKNGMYMIGRHTCRYIEEDHLKGFMIST